MSEDAATRPIGLIGLGLLGKAITTRLLGAGYPVCGFDIDEAARDHAKNLGVDVASGPEVVAERCGVILLSLPNSDIRQELLFKEGLTASLAEGTLLLDTTTGRAEDLEADAQRLAETQIDLVDVCVLASSAQMAAGEAVLLVGDREEAAQGYAELLRCMSRRIFYLGAAGDGCRMKLVANQVLGLHRLVLAEGLAMAERVGLNPEMTLEVLKSGPAASAVMDSKGRKMLEEDFEPVARLAQHAKDVDLILELGAAVGAHTPLSEIHRDILQRLIAEGFGGEDNAAVIRAFRERR